ncbi:hypothetical protein [Streptomyces sp. AN091965]|uniref:hypothetical protein n=1 Tax=Streptomyces sp. AN091965 TaxID=2927803 RepID=UPI001F604D07|nr:hypothetical protein [Streptomyces sp. AN091965]MCI3930924.1 hypothetical protein [Streptomyces sp. AN091965]
MPLTATQKTLIDANLGDPEAISAVIMGFCWNESALASAADFVAHEAETLLEAANRLGLGWNPIWLREAGFTAFDANGTSIDQLAEASGPVNWSPQIRTFRFDDKISDAATGTRYRRRTSGELAALSLWMHAVTARDITIDRPSAQPGGTRGTVFRDLLIYYLQRSLPEGWQVRHEVPLTHIRGLHMRRDVGDRKSDILIIDDGSRLVAALSSKWSWRSDRGTEAAQMVPLTRYRPDVPYAMATAEFPRAASVARESIEDRIYHLCPTWVGAWLAVNELAPGTSAHAHWPNLTSLRQEGEARASALALKGLDVLVRDLKDSGDIL